MSQANTQGYWLIEPDEVSIILSTPELQPLAGKILNWLATTVSDHLDLESHGVRISVIQAQYLGPPYPCLGVQGDDIPESLQNAIVNEIDDLLKQTPLASFLKHVAAA